MGWSIEIKVSAAKTINKLDAHHRERIRDFLKKQSTQSSPRTTGKAL